MPEPTSLVLTCTHCGYTAPYPTATLIPRGLFNAATFRPQRCAACREEAATPAPPPYQLTYNDRQMLKRLLIAADDDGRSVRI
jgi:hypothetical protein